MRKHLDSNVVYFMLLIIVLGFAVSAFRYQQHIPCEGFGIQLQNKPYYVGEFISFKDATKGAENWRWNFGDSTAIKTGKEVLHKFKTVGIHTVSLQINGVCEAERKITIRDQKIISPKNIFFIAPDKVAVGETFEVTDTTSTSTSWEWRFGDGLSEVAMDRNVTHSYEEPGTKTIRLIVNGSDYVSYQSIEVYEKEVEEEPVNRIKKLPKALLWDIKDKPIDEEDENNTSGAPKEVPLISKQEFQAQLELLAAGKTLTQSFGKYFCGGDLNKSITTDRKGINTFLKLCMDIKGRKIAIRSLELIRNDGFNCINNLIIAYKRKGKFREKAAENTTENTTEKATESTTEKATEEIKIEAATEEIKAAAQKTPIISTKS